MDDYSDLFVQPDPQFKEVLEEVISNPYYLDHQPEYIGWCKLQLYEMDIAA